MVQAQMASSDRLTVLQGFLAQDPSNDRLRADLFQVALEQGEVDLANRQVEWGMQQPIQEVAWRHRQIVLWMAQGCFGDARDGLLALIAEGHDDLTTRYNLAYTQFALGAVSNAREEAALLIPADGEVGELAWLLWLRCEHHSSRLDEGLQAFTEAMAKRNPSPEAWGVASLMAFDAERLDESRAWAERALEGDPRQLEALVTTGTLALGRQDVPEATRRFEQAIQLKPLDGRTWSGMAFTKMLSLDIPSAQTAFEKAVTYMPFHIGTWIGMGWCEFMAGRPEAARDAFERALKLDHSFAESHGSLAVALARLDLPEAAATEAKVALKLDPRCLSARYAQHLLEGEAGDSDAFARMAQRYLSQHPVAGEEGKTLADVVLKYGANRATRP